MNTSIRSTNLWRMALLFTLCCAFWGLAGAILFLVIAKPMLGFVFGGLIGMVYWMIGCWASDMFALDVYHAEPLNSDVAPKLLEMVQELSISAAIEVPLVYSVAYSEPNALAIARSSRGPVIVVTNGLTVKLEREEVRAVLALMIARLADPDAVAWSVATTLAGLPLYGAASGAWRDRIPGKLAADEKTGLTVLDRALLSCIVPPCALALGLAFDRKHLAEVDRRAAELGGGPALLASALEKINKDVPRTWWGGSTYNPATAFLFAVPPMSRAEVLDDDTSGFCRRAQAAFSSRMTNADERSKELLAPG